MEIMRIACFVKYISFVLVEIKIMNKVYGVGKLGGKIVGVCKNLTSFRFG